MFFLWSVVLIMIILLINIWTIVVTILMRFFFLNRLFMLHKDHRWYSCIQSKMWQISTSLDLSGTTFPQHINI